MAIEKILVFARMAGSSVGVTTKDRPEWIAANPLRAEVYCALTNNKDRGVKANAGGDETPLRVPNPREINNYCQIVRWWPTGDDHGADSFKWDLHVMAGNPEAAEGAYRGSPNVTAGTVFGLMPSSWLSAESEACPYRHLLRKSLSGNGSLYGSSDGLCRRGASVTNLPHVASFHS